MKLKSVFKCIRLFFRHVQNIHNEKRAKTISSYCQITSNNYHHNTDFSLRPFIQMPQMVITHNPSALVLGRWLILNNEIN